MRRSFKRFIPGIAWFFLVLYLVCLPGSAIPSAGWMQDINIDKAVHIILFGTLVFLFCWAIAVPSTNNGARLSYFLKIAMAVSLWGLATEFIQKFYIPGRSFDLLDWAADSCGALIAWFFARRLLLLKR